MAVHDSQRQCRMTVSPWTYSHRILSCNPRTSLRLRRGYGSRAEAKSRAKSCLASPLRIYLLASSREPYTLLLVRGLYGGLCLVRETEVLPSGPRPGWAASSPSRSSSSIARGAPGPSASAPSSSATRPRCVPLPHFIRSLIPPCNPPYSNKTEQDHQTEEKVPARPCRASTRAPRPTGAVRLE